MTTVAVQIVDRGTQQYGQISEPVSYKDSIANALAHFGVSYSNISWDFRNDNRGIGTVDGTTKIVSYVRTD